MPIPLLGLLVVACFGFGVLQFKHLGHPLIWQDEGETVMFAQRILEHGYPKVRDGRNTVYGLGVPLSVGTREADDAYIGSLWGQYWFATLGVRWAAAIEDPWARTARLRLPFALAGVAGLLLVFSAVAPAFAAARRGALSPAIGYVALLCLSTSLILHVREARYYALVVLSTGAVLRVHRAHVEAIDAGRAAAWGIGALQALLLFALFNVFYPAAVSLGAWLALEAFSSARRAGRPLTASRQVAHVGGAVGLAALACVPLAVHFEVAALSSVFSERYAFGWRDYLANLGASAFYLLRYEFLGLALLLLACRLGLQRRDAFADDPARATSNALWRLCGIWIVLGARNPIFFERYLVPTSPIFAAIVVLESHSLLRSLRAPGARLRLRSPVVWGCAAVALASVVVKAPEWTGRVAEIRRVQRGPLDFVIPYLMQHADAPASLRIATNYEAEPYMYYLGARVVGRFHDPTPEAVEREQAAEVDVVVPRRAWSRNLDRVLRYLKQADFERVEFPVADLPYNNIPELYAGRVLSTTHAFETRPPGGDFGPLVIRVRRSVQKDAPGTLPPLEGARER